MGGLVLAKIYSETSRRFIDSSTLCWLLTVPDRSQDVAIMGQDPGWRPAPDVCLWSAPRHTCFWDAKKHRVLKMG